MVTLHSGGERGGSSRSQAKPKDDQSADGLSPMVARSTNQVGAVCHRKDCRNLVADRERAAVTFRNRVKTVEGRCYRSVWKIGGYGRTPCCQQQWIIAEGAHVGMLDRPKASQARLKLKPTFPFRSSEADDHDMWRCG